MISVTVFLDPVAKGRPRFGMGRTYTPKSTRDFEKMFALHASQHKPLKPLLGPLRVDVKFQIKRPKSVKRPYPSCKPDLDNFLKTLDSLNGIFWEDDSQIIDVRASKRYGPMGAIQVQLEGVS